MPRLQTSSRTYNRHGGRKPPHRIKADPLYVVALGDGTYYSRDVAWHGVPRHKATWLTHAEAESISSRVKQPRIGCKASVEPLHGGAK
jgi:hypothetical protein